MSCFGFRLHGVILCENISFLPHGSYPCIRHAWEKCDRILTCEAESLALFVKVESTPCCIFQRYTGKIRSYKTSQNYRDWVKHCNMEHDEQGKLSTGLSTSSARIAISCQPLMLFHFFQHHFYQTSMKLLKKLYPQQVLGSCFFYVTFRSSGRNSFRVSVIFSFSGIFCDWKKALRPN